MNADRYGRSNHKTRLGLGVVAIATGLLVGKLGILIVSLWFAGHLSSIGPVIRHEMPNLVAIQLPIALVTSFLVVWVTQRYLSRKPPG